MKRYDGRNGTPVNITSDDKVHDVSDSLMWRSSRHWADHETGGDHRTCELRMAILYEETEHQWWLSEFLGEAPAGYFMRWATTFPLRVNLLNEVR